MPSTSKKQHNLMAAVAKNPAFAKKVGIKQSVGEDFLQADKGKKFRSGGYTRPSVEGVNRPKTDHGQEALFAKGGNTMATKMSMFEKSGKDVEKRGMKEGSKADMALDKKQMMGMKKGGMKKMATGGMTTSSMGAVKTAAPSRDGIAERGKTRGMMPKMAGSDTGMKRGGKVRK
jgi:hypothetical protein